MKPSDVPDFEAAVELLRDQRIVRAPHDSGWPRMFIRAWIGSGQRRRPTGPRHLPAPWVAGADIIAGRFGVLDDTRLKNAVKYRLCAVCGLFVAPVGMTGIGGDVVAGPLVFMRYYGANLTPELRGMPLTDGPGCCVRCALLAARFCPHLTEQLAERPDDTIAFVHTGSDAGCEKVPEHTSLVLVLVPYRPVTHAELRELAKHWTPDGS